MNERGESSSSHRFFPNGETHAPATPAKLGQPDPNKICENGLGNPYNESVFKTSFSCWDANFGSTSQNYEINGGSGTFNFFSMDDLDNWNSISCRDLLALADATLRNDSDCGFGGGGGYETHQYGRPNLLCDLNSPPQTMPEPLINTGLSLQFTPLTPDLTKRLNLAADNNVSTLDEVNQDSEKELTEQTNLNETPQQKQKRRKHRPKVVTEGKPKRMRKPDTPKPTTPKPDRPPTGKRKYVRRKGVEKSTAAPNLEETSGVVHTSPDQQAKKTCKRKIDFDESEKQAEAGGGVESYEKVHESESPNPITPSKTELPQARSKRKYTKAKCQINFPQEETHGKGPSQNESGCSTSVCNNGDEAQRLNGDISSEIDKIKLLQEQNMGLYRDSLESFLSVYTEYNRVSNNCLQLSVINKEKAPETPKDRYMQTCGENSKRRKIMVHESFSFGGYQQKRTKKKTKKSSMVSSLYHDRLGFNPNLRCESIADIDVLIYRFERLHINSDAVVPYMSGYHEKNALVVYQQERILVPYEGLFDPIKKRKLRPKVELDDETNRVWMLLLEDINSKGIDGTDEDKKKWWEEERRVFRGRVDLFIARMHLVQGDRRFSRWKGSVLDSVVGVFLTQNVSDHLSSSAFMSLAARYPLKNSADTCSKSEEQNDRCKAPVDGHTSFVELLHMQGRITQKNSENCASEESGMSAESASQTMVHMFNTISSQESANSTCMVRQVLETTNLSTENSKASLETVQKVVDFHANKNGSNQMTNATDEGCSKAKKEKTGKTVLRVDWDKLRFHAEAKPKRERTPDNADSMDYDAIRKADVNDVADAIKERGMNNRLAARIKDMLDRLFEDHGSIDLEWLRDVPPDKAKEYLLSFKGLGLKSVECIRLLTLHHLAFPVDTNVGRIAVRLGWVPLQPLPESLQLHLLELYPVQETIQKYLWPRLCKLDQRTLYELHYQMITFGKVFCTKTKPNCNACPLRGECRHFASAFASARLSLPAPEPNIARLTENRTGQNPIGMIDLPSASEPKQMSEVQSGNPVIEELAAQGTIVEIPSTPGPIVEVPSTPGPIVEVLATAGPIVEVPATPGPIVEVPASPEPEQIQQEVFDIEEFSEDTDEIPMIRLNIEEFTQNLQTYMERHMELGECDMSKALVALTTEAASIPTPKLKNVNQLRTEHHVYELPDSHPLLDGLDTREPDDPSPYLLAIWTPGETADSIQPPEGQCSSQESGTLCNEETCFFCNSTREVNSQTVRGTILIPCRTAMRGSFPLNGTYFQVNEVFADHDSSLNPIDVPRAWLWNLPRRTVYFGTSIPTIFKGLTTEEIQLCFWRGFVCVRGFDQKTRAPRPLMARLHFPASRLKNQPKPKTDEKEKLMQ